VSSIAALSSRDVFEATAGDVERFAYRDTRILVLTARFVSRARCRSHDRARCRVVIDDHVFAGQRQRDANVQRPAVSPVTVRYFNHHSTSDNSWMERVKPRHA
jgi:hypothetical protein